MGKHDIFANTRNIIHKGSGDKALASAPDVCKTPVGPAVVPIPYPNLSQSSTLTNGSKTVKLNGQPAMLKKSLLKSSSGDQAGSVGGVISGVTGKEIEALSYSFDVKIEGRNVVRHVDGTFHNKKNTMGMLYGSTSPSISLSDTTNVYQLRFMLIDKLGKPLKHIPYKSMLAGTKQSDMHIEDGKTAADGKTPIVSTTQNEKMELHIVWAKLKINKDYFKAAPAKILPKR